MDSVEYAAETCLHIGDSALYLFCTLSKFSIHSSLNLDFQDIPRPPWPLLLLLKDAFLIHEGFIVFDSLLFASSCYIYHRRQSSPSQIPGTAYDCSIAWLAANSMVLGLRQSALMCLILVEAFIIEQRFES